MNLKLDERTYTAAVIAFGIILRLALWFLVPVTTDAGAHLAKARFIGENLTIPVFENLGNDPFWYPPLFHIITSVLYKLTGMLRLTPLLAGILSLFVFYRLARRFYPDTLPYSIILLSILPFHAYMTGTAYVTILLFLWGVLAVFFYRNYLDKGLDRDLGLTIIFSACAALTHHHGLLLGAIIFVDFYFKKPLPAITFIVLMVLLASPWYIRNYVVFGNPIWPLFFEGKYQHAKTHSGYGVSGVGNLLKLETFKTVFFEFWIGPPNSGPDLMDNIRTGRNMFPYIFELGMVLWLVVIIVVSALILRGFYLFLREYQWLPVLAFMFSLAAAPFLPSARIIVFSVPFMVLAFGKSVKSIGKTREVVVLLILSGLVFTGAPMAYAFTYDQIIKDYEPFYEMMDSNLDSDAAVLMPYTLQECLYYTNLHCVRLRDFPNGVPPEIAFGGGDLTQYGVTHVCCDSLYWGARNDKVKQFCRSFDQEPVINYSRDNVWGRCWRVDG